MKLSPYRSATTLVLCLLATFATSFTVAQQTPSQDPAAQALVQRAVEAELAANRDDHSLWRYRVVEKLENNSVYDSIDTSQGGLRRKIEQNGHALTPAEQQAQSAKIQAFVNDPRAQAKQKRDGQHDDESADKMLKLLPRAFFWKVAHQSGKEIVLHFVPNAGFNPPDNESRVLAAMEGDLVVDAQQHRIATIRGRLSHDVNIGFGILARLREGGTFDVERRQIGPNVWQITETHVHIDGRALLLKTIGEQTEEVKSGFQPIPPDTTLAQAAAMLGAN